MEVSNSSSLTFGSQYDKVSVKLYLWYLFNPSLLTLFNFLKDISMFTRTLANKQSFISFYDQYYVYSLKRNLKSIISIEIILANLFPQRSLNIHPHHYNKITGMKTDSVFLHVSHICTKRKYDTKIWEQDKKQGRVYTTRISKILFSSRMDPYFSHF